MLLNSENKVFVGQRIDFDTNAWQMPQGGIDGSEDPKTAMLRELEEEIGTNKVAIIAETPQWLQYDLPDKYLTHFWGGKYKGQRQKWFLCRLLGSDELININTARPEFQSWRWANINEITKLIVPFKREMYQEVVDHFTSFINSK
jgi:putative (di)nucleoside polyphosphate hydrolase